jgi:hypothetical protein
MEMSGHDAAPDCSKRRSSMATATVDTNLSIADVISTAIRNGKSRRETISALAKAGVSENEARMQYDEVARSLKGVMRMMALKQIWSGVGALVVGVLITWVSFMIAPGGFFIVTYGLIAVGILRIVGGLWRLVTC